MKLSLLACTLPFSRDIRLTLALLFWNCLKHSQVKEKTAIQEINAKCIRIQEERQAQD